MDRVPLIQFAGFVLIGSILTGCFRQDMPDCADERTIRLVQQTASRHLSLKEIIVNPATIKITGIQTLTQVGYRCMCSAELVLYDSRRFPITYSGKLRKKKNEFHIEVHGLP